MFGCWASSKFGFPSLIQELFQLPCREKHGVAVGWVILVGFFPPFIKGQGLFWRRGKLQEGVECRREGLLFWAPLCAESPTFLCHLLLGWWGGHWNRGQLLCSLVQSLGRAGLPRCAGWLCSPGDLCGVVYVSLSLAVRFSAGRWLSPHRGRVAKEAWQRHVKCFSTFCHDLNQVFPSVLVQGVWWRSRDGIIYVEAAGNVWSGAVHGNRHSRPWAPRWAAVLRYTVLAVAGLIACLDTFPSVPGIFITVGDGDGGGRDLSISVSIRRPKGPVVVSAVSVPVTRAAIRVQLRCNDQQRHLRVCNWWFAAAHGAWWDPLGTSVQVLTEVKFQRRCW